MKYGVIKENHLFVKTYERGKRVMTARLGVFLLTDKQARRLQKAHPRHEITNRVGISVGKKQGGAVQRNRAKRLIREALRQVEKEHTLVKGKLLVLNARGDCAKASLAEVKKDLLYALFKLGMIADTAKPAAAQAKPVAGAADVSSADIPSEEAVS